MRISNLTINNLRCFRDFEIVIESSKKSQVIFLAGENGSGKSTILWALAAGTNQILGNQQPVFDSFSRIGEYRISFEMSDYEKNTFGEETVRYEVDWASGRVHSRPLGQNTGTRMKQYRQDKENVDRTKVGTLEYLPPDRFISTEQGETLKTIATGEVETRSSHDDLNFTRYRKTGDRYRSKYRDVPRQFGTLIQSDIRRQRQTHLLALEEESSLDSIKDLALQIQEQSHYELIKKAIAKYLPNITLGPFEDQSENPPNMILLTPTGEKIALTQLSSGEFQIVVWLIDLIQKELRNSIILWDEPEQHLHPSLSMRIPEMLRDLCPGSQIWIATQSPFVISSATEDDTVYYLERKQSGSVELLKDSESKIQSFRKLTPDGFLATWGRQVIFVEGKDDISFFQKLLDSLEIAAIATQLTSKPSLSKLDIVLNEINNQWEVPMAVAVVDRDYYEMKEFSQYSLIECYSGASCDLEGLFLEPQYLVFDTFESTAEEELQKRNEKISSKPVEQLINMGLQNQTLQKKLYRESFVHTLRRHIGSELQDKNLDLNQLENDAKQRLSDVINSFIPTLSMSSLSFTYPEILSWCKGKVLLPEIGKILGIPSPRRFISILSDRVVKDPPKHLVRFLKKVSEEFDSS